MADLLKKILLGIFERPMPMLTDEHRRYAEELRRYIADHALTLSDDATESERSWHRFNEELRTCIEQEDPREFLQWNVIRKSMFVSNPSYVAKEFRYLKALPDWKLRWKPAIAETAIGRPRPYTRHPRSSGNLIHHAYHVARFERALDIQVDTLGRVFEFGGGYGSMARLFFQLGFRGNYLIYDFPYFSALQRFFLRSIGYVAELDADCDESGVVTTAPQGGVCCLSDIVRLRDGLQADPQPGGRLFLATWSISEAPLAVREEIMPLAGECDYFLIAFQHRFEEIDNLAYFRAWSESMGSAFQWQCSAIDHLPGNSYLFGRRVT